MDCREKGQINKGKKEADEEIRRKINRSSALAFTLAKRALCFSIKCTFSH